MDLDTEIASRVVKAISAAAEAVTCCDAARIHAIGVVAAGNGVAAGDAYVRCDVASSAALEVAARCETAAEGADTNYRTAATTAAKQARDAAARCVVEGGGPAATQAANACADICVLACRDAAAKALAAREAAARCALARDIADTEALVSQKTASNKWRGVLTFRIPYQEFEFVHKEAREDATTTALAARRATLRCAAASRRAVSAASIARKAAFSCEQAGGEGVVAAVKAREAANRCVAAHGNEVAVGAHVAEGAAREVVPPASAEADGVVIAEEDAGENHANAAANADAAALEARDAAARCDAALADPLADADEDFMDKMRGWLMTVATLFVAIAFQAILQRPPAMYGEPWFSSSKAEKTAFGAPSPAPAASTDTHIPSYYSTSIYVICNTLTMAVALAMLVLLMTMKKATSRVTLWYVKSMLTVLAFSVGGSFITAMYGVQEDLLDPFFFFLLIIFVFGSSFVFNLGERHQFVQ